MHGSKVVVVTRPLTLACTVRLLGTWSTEGGCRHTDWPRLLVGTGCCHTWCSLLPITNQWRLGFTALAGWPPLRPDRGSGGPCRRPRALSLGTERVYPTTQHGKDHEEHSRDGSGARCSQRTDAQNVLDICCGEHSRLWRRWGRDFRRSHCPRAVRAEPATRCDPGVARATPTRCSRRQCRALYRAAFNHAGHADAPVKWSGRLAVERWPSLRVG